MTRRIAATGNGWQSDALLRPKMRPSPHGQLRHALQLQGATETGWELMPERMRHVWHSIREPRHIKGVYFGYYLAVILTGLITAISPPDIVESAVGLHLTWWFSAFLIFGGSVASVAVFPGWWWLERIGNWSAIVAAAIFIMVVVYQAIANDSSSGMTQAGMGVLATGLFVVRLLMIRKYSFEPRG